MSSLRKMSVLPCTRTRPRAGELAILGCAQQAELHACQVVVVWNALLRRGKPRREARCKPRPSETEGGHALRTPARKPHSLESETRERHGRARSKWRQWCGGGGGGCGNDQPAHMVPLRRQGEAAYCLQRRGLFYSPSTNHSCSMTTLNRGQRAV